MIDHTGITTEVYSYFYNGRGDIIQVIDDTGAVVVDYAYDSFGLPESATGTLNQNFRFSTKFLDPESGFIYYGYRWYSPETMRWLSMDPLGEAGGLNQYQFVQNNSVNLIDALGLLVEAIFDKSTGIFTVTDTNTGVSISVSAESGGKPFGDPIPTGSYEILDQARNPNFFRLDPVDTNPRNDTHEPTGRGQFRLHGPGRTIGCIACKFQAPWNRILDLINNTSTTTVKDKFVPWWKFWAKDAGDIKKFGDLEVKDGGSSK